MRGGVADSGEWRIDPGPAERDRRHGRHDRLAASVLRLRRRQEQGVHSTRGFWGYDTTVVLDEAHLSIPLMKPPQVHSRDPARWLATRVCFLVSTSAGEAGIDIDADHLIMDLAPLDRMMQRLGRVNRGSLVENVRGPDRVCGR